MRKGGMPYFSSRLTTIIIYFYMKYIHSYKSILSNYHIAVLTCFRIAFVSYDEVGLDSLLVIASLCNEMIYQ